MTDQAEKQSVAVLVIDDFGELASDKERDKEQKKKPFPRYLRKYPQDENCIVRPNGQAIYDTGGVIGPRPQDLDQPHGFYVYDVLEEALEKEMGQAASTQWNGWEKGYPKWIRQVSEWDKDETKLLLVAVDTENFTTSTIHKHIEEAITLLEKKEDIHRFVLNMSFAIVPCRYVEAYLNILESDKKIGEIETTLGDLAGAKKSTDLQTKIGDMASSIPRRPKPLSPTETEIDRAKLAEKLILQGSYPHPARKPRVSADPPPRQLRDYLQDIYDYLQDTFTPDPFRDYCRAIYKEDFLTRDPLHKWLSRWNAPDSGLASSERIVIPVAAAGNGGEQGYNDYPFAPAIFDSVVSVGALDEDDRGEKKRRASGKKGAKNTYSNPGEITMPGRLDTSKVSPDPLKGTSFAAPRFSAKAAIYLRNGGEGPLPNTVIPPLGYADDYGPWNNMKYADAKDDLSISTVSPTCWPDP